MGYEQDLFLIPNSKFLIQSLYGKTNKIRQ